MKLWKRNQKIKLARFISAEQFYTKCLKFAKILGHIVKLRNKSPWIMASTNPVFTFCVLHAAYSGHASVVLLSALKLLIELACSFLTQWLYKNAAFTSEDTGKFYTPNNYGRIQTSFRVAASLKRHQWNSFKSKETKWWRNKQKPLFHPLEMKSVRHKVVQQKVLKLLLSM